jgi:hypothetical protein
MAKKVTLGQSVNQKPRDPVDKPSTHRRVAQDAAYVNRLFGRKAAKKTPKGGRKAGGGASSG